MVVAEMSTSEAQLQDARGMSRCLSIWMRMIQRDAREQYGFEGTRTTMLISK